MSARRLVECVPNFSEGRDTSVINAIADAVRAVPGVTLLDVDPGASTHRTVYTFVGEPDAVVNAAVAAAKVARQKIDMRKHKGTHVDILSKVGMINGLRQKLSSFNLKLYRLQ